MFLGRGSRGSNNSILTDYQILGKQKSQIRHLYIQNPKSPKNTKIPKIAKNGQIEPKVSFFDLLAISNSNTFG